MATTIFSTGELQRWYQYVSIDPDADPEPSMCLAKQRQVDGGRCAAVIPLTCAHKYYPQTPQEIVEAHASASAIAMALQLPIDSSALARLVLFIQDGLDHLLAMPPWSEARQVIGEARITDNGVTHHVDLYQ